MAQLRDTHAQIRTAVDQSLDKLKSRIRDLDPRTYLEARNFLTSLGHEAQPSDHRRVTRRFLAGLMITCAAVSRPALENLLESSSEIRP